MSKETEMEVAAVAEEIKALTPPQKLRLAADLLDQKRGDLAYVIAEGVVLEIGALLALQRLEARPARMK